MSDSSSNLDGGQLLSEFSQKDPRGGALLAKIISAINTLSDNLSSSPSGQSTPPAPPDAVNVTSAGEMVHVQITHNAPVKRGIQYFTEVSNSKSFTQPIVIDHGSSRTSHPFPLPTKDSKGNTHNWYFRSFAQYHGSAPSAPVVFGGASDPTAVNLSGTTQLDLLPSLGSGTASPTGFQGAQGLGVFASRPALAPKRAAK